MIGLCSVTFRDKKAEEIITLAKETGLETIEWSSKSHVLETEPEQAKETAALMEAYGLKTLSYGTYYRLGSFKDFEQYIKVAKILGAIIIRVWAGELGSKETDNNYRQKIVKDAQRIGELAAKENLLISLEYHANTLTDTPESTVQLMEEIESPHVSLYWQPAENLTIKERLESLPKLSQWITNVHVFHWEHYRNRFPLKDGFEEWKQYIEIIEKYSPYDQNYLLEFVPGEDQELGFYESVETLKKLVENN